jgi:hypothetical protein
MEASQDKMTKMVAAPKKVKIRAVTAIDYLGVQLKPGQEAEVSEEVAAEYCDRTFKGMFSFSGERDSKQATRNNIVRAVRV